MQGVREGGQHRGESLPVLRRGESGSSLAKRTEHRRVLKPTGSIYLHCDPTAGHYLRMLLDAVFGPENFRTEYPGSAAVPTATRSKAGNSIPWRHYEIFA